MSFRLFTTGDNLGALTLYARKVDAFGHEDLLDGLILATHAAVALAANRRRTTCTPRWRPGA